MRSTMNFTFKVTNVADAGVDRVNIAFQQVPVEGEEQMGPSNLNLNLTTDAAVKEGFFPGGVYTMTMSKA